MTCHRVRSWIGGFAILGVALACGDTEQPVPQGPTNGTAVADSGNLDRRFYERNFVFASVAADSSCRRPRRRTA